MRILIAEDESIIRLGLKSMLQELGHEVFAAANGREALQMARHHDPELAILDIKMPYTDGLQAARTLARTQPMPILLLTAFSQQDLIEEAAELPIQGYLVKPIKTEELAAAIAVATRRFADMQVLALENQKLEDQLLTRKLIERAKGKLMQDGLSEEEAYLAIQEQARSNRQSIKQAALAFYRRSYKKRPCTNAGSHHYGSERLVATTAASTPSSTTSAGTGIRSNRVNVNSSASTSTSMRTRSPAANSPFSRRTDSGLSTKRWMARFNGRAPKSLSNPWPASQRLAPSVSSMRQLTLLSQPFLHITHLQIDDLDHIFFAQRLKDDDLVNTIDELRPEGRLQGVFNALVVCGLFLVTPAGEAQGPGAACTNDVPTLLVITMTVLRKLTTRP